MDEHTMHNNTGWVTPFVFIAGFLLGAGTAMLLIPEAGPPIRSRIARGAKTAKHEFADMAQQTREAVHTWSDEAKQTMKYAANQVNSAVDSTRQAVQTESFHE